MFAVYRIRNTITGDEYIGSSGELQRRWRRHRHALRRNIHHAVHLQRAWNKYGETAFRFEVIDYAEDADELTGCEQQYLISCKPEYNSSQDTRAFNRGLHFKLRPESIAKFVATRTGRPWTPAQRAAFAGKARGNPKKAARARGDQMRGKPRTDIDPAKQAEAVRQMWANMPPEQRAERLAKLAEARARKKAQNGG